MNLKNFNLKQTIAQASKFLVTGFINTAIDFGVLNLLMWIFKINQGPWIILLNVISFTCAVTNSYFLNKYWTFKEKSHASGGQFIQFVILTAIGAVMNTAIVYGFSTYLKPAFGLTPQLWANVGKVLATAIILFYNFINYKLIIFKKAPTDNNSTK